MKTVQRKTEELIPYAQNQKKHPKSQVKIIADSIKEFGFVQPVVLDGKGEIIIGHGRVLAAKLLEIAKVPCVVMDNLTEDQVKALRIMDNKSNESPWDKGLLKAELETLYESKYDIQFTGFDPTELGKLGVGVDPDKIEPINASGPNKSPFQQKTFTLSDEQAEVIEKAIAKVKRTQAYKDSETFGNANRQGNALYVICQQWAEQKK